LATVIAQCGGAVWVMFYLLGKKRPLRFRLETLKLRWPIVKSMLAIGFSSFIFQIVTGMIQVIFNKSLGQYGGDIAIASGRDQLCAGVGRMRERQNQRQTRDSSQRNVKHIQSITRFEPARAADDMIKAR
jgi:hypothetical protein